MIRAVKNKWIFLIVIGIITGFFAYQLKNMSFEHKIESFFNKKENYYRFNKEFFNQFSHKKSKQPATQELILILDNHKVITHDFLINVNNLSKDLNQLNGVEKVRSIINTPLYVFTSFGRYPYKLFHLDDPSQFKEDLKRAKGYSDITDRYLSKDLTATIVRVTLNKGADIDSILNVKSQIENLVANTKNKYHIDYYNGLLTRYLVVNKLKANSTILTILAGLLVVLILFIFLRSITGVIIPLSIVVICVVWILGTISFMGVSLNVLTIAIPVLVGVISLSDVIHIIARYTEEKTDDKHLKLLLTQKDMLRAIVLTSVTTSLGFLSLIPSNIQVFIEFGFFSTLGVIYAFVLAYFLLPIFLHYGKPLKLNNYLKYVTPKKLYTKPTLIISSFLIVIIAIGVYKVENRSYIYDDINSDDIASKTIKKVEQNFYGIRDLSLAITLNKENSKVLDLNTLYLLDSIEQKAFELYGTENFYSLCLFIKQVYRAKNGGNSDYFKLPKNEKELKKILKYINKNSSVFPIEQLISEDKKSTFIYGKIKDKGSKETLKNNNLIVQWSQKNFKDYLTLTPTGGSNIIDQTNYSVTTTMMISLTIIMLIIMILIAILFKSVKLGLLSVFPNTMPLLVIMAVVGWFDMGMSITITIVFTIVFGIAVDDTIHFLSRYRIEKKKKQSNTTAIENCIKTSGGAISLTTIILVAGFGTLIFSDFRANFVTGLLGSIGLITAVLCDLFLLPVLMNLVTKKQENIN